MGDSLLENRPDDAGGIHGTGPGEIHSGDHTRCLPHRVEECEKRKRCQVALPRTDTEVVTQEQRLCGKVLMGVHRPFGLPGAPGGERDCGEVIRTGRWKRHWLGPGSGLHHVLKRSAAPKPPRAHGYQSANGFFRPAEQNARRVRHGDANEGAWTCLGKAPREVHAADARVDEHRYSSAPQETERKHEQRLARSNQQCNAVASLDSQGGQPLCAGVTLPIEFIEANRSFGEDVSRLGGAIERSRSQERGEIARLGACHRSHASVRGCAARNERTRGTMRSAASSST